MVSIIAALSENRVIGKDNKIPWHIKEDLVRLKQLTLHHAVILGKNTYESMLGYYAKSGKSTMSERFHIVVTSDLNYTVDPDKGIVAHSVEEALEIAKKHYELNTSEIFVLGGASLFKQTIDLADKLYLTVVKGNFEGDSFFPDYAQFTKVIEKKEEDNGEYKYTFLTLER